MITLTTYACGCQVRTEADGRQVIAARCTDLFVMCCRPIHLDTVTCRKRNTED